MNIVEQYWSSAVVRLQAEVEGFNRLIGHAGEQGHENELSLSRLLSNLIPRRLGVGGGMIIDNENRRSKQTDIVIYDLADQPTLMAQSSQVIFPLEVVHAAIEVKTTLTAAEIKDCAEKKQALSLLKAADGREGPFFAVLAYDAWAQPNTVAEHLHEIPVEKRPDLVCLLNPGLMAGTMISSSGSYEVGFYPLHSRGSSGERQKGDWMVQPTLPAGSMLNTFGGSYPVTKIKDIGYIAGDPGRALLLFCDAILRSLADRKAIPQPALMHYLTETAREMISLPEKSIA